MRQGAFGTYAAHLAVIAGLFLLQYLLPAYHMGNLTRIMVYAVLAIGYNILFGYTGLMSLGHAMFFASGAYGAGLSVHWLGFSPFAALLAGIATAFLVSVVAGVVLLRVSGVAFLIVTLMLAQTAFLATLYFNNITLGDQGIVLALRPVEVARLSFALSDPVVKYNVALLAFALVLLFSLWLLRSPFGRILVAVRENEARTRLLGYNTFIYRFWALVISGTISGLAGAIYCLLFAYVGSSFASLQYSTLPLLYTLLGGTGVTLGPFIGTAIMYYLIDISSEFTSSYMIIVGAALLVITLWFPDGIAGQWRRLVQRRPA